MTPMKRDSEVVERNGYALFWNGWPSQWHPCEFVVDGVSYNCCEQFMMAEKARVFGDQESLRLIQTSRSPREQKAAGRKVRGFLEGKWNEVCRGIVYRGNLAKFSLNQSLRELLIATGSQVIVEASPFDRIWGIGLDKDDPRAIDATKWQGKNWLGIALMQVRQTLITAADGKSQTLDSELEQQLEHRRAML